MSSPTMISKVTLAIAVNIVFINAQHRGDNAVAHKKCANGILSKDSGLELRFSTSQIDRVCSMEDDWLQRAAARADAPKSKLTEKQFNWLTDVWECSSLACLCQFDPSQVCGKVLDKLKQIDNILPPTINETIVNKPPGVNLPVKVPEIGNVDKNRFGSLFNRNKRQLNNILSGIKPVTRKEIRMMTDDERQKFFAALNAVKTQLIDGASKYDILIVYHTPEYSPGAHFGPALLPFHRELLKQLELVLRAQDPTVALPYWDSTLDELLPNGADSILWTEEFLGDPFGEVSSGPFATWRTANDSQLGQITNSLRITRDVGKSQFGGVYKKKDIERIMKYKNYEDLTYCVDPYFEMVHGTVHMYVGGHMATVRISPNDPVFFLLHCYIDYIWEKWRQENQSPEQRTTEYPSDDRSCNQYHYAQTVMKPFIKLKNKDGLSNTYTDSLYKYDPAPVCSPNNLDCGSKYIFCHVAGGYRCVSKIRVGGNCTGFDEAEACYDGMCVNNRCIQNTKSQPTPPPTTASTAASSQPLNTVPNVNTKLRDTVTPPSPTSIAPTISESTVFFPVTILRLSTSGVIPYTKARIIADSGENQLNIGSIIDRNDDKYYSGAALVEMPAPSTSSGSVTSTILVFDEDLRQCVAMCLAAKTVKPWRYDPCVAKVTLTTSDNTIDVTNNKSAWASLAWDENQTKKPDPFMFICGARATLPRTSDNTTTTVAPTNEESSTIPTCVDDHRCCFLFAEGDKSECRRSGWMQHSCRRSCGLCADDTPLRHVATSQTVTFARSGNSFQLDSKRQLEAQQDDDLPNGEACIDLYGRNCTAWAGKSQCALNTDWMEANCARSCGVCARSRREWNNVCGLPNVDGECEDYHDECPMWASRRECLVNTWWMAHNCPLSCNKCQRK